MIIVGLGWLSLTVGEIWLASDGHGDWDWPSLAVTRKHLMKGLYGQLIGKCLSGCPLTVDVWCRRRGVLVHVCDYTHTLFQWVMSLRIAVYYALEVSLFAFTPPVMMCWREFYGFQTPGDVSASLFERAPWINLSLTHLVIFESFALSCV